MACLWDLMTGRTVNMDVKEALCNRMELPTLMYASETQVCNESQGSKAVEMSYLRDASGVNRIDGVSNESVYR